MAKQFGVNIGLHFNYIKEALQKIVDKSNPTDDECKQAKEVAKEQYLAVIFLMRSDRGQYGGLI